MCNPMGQREGSIQPEQLLVLGTASRSIAQATTVLFMASSPSSGNSGGNWLVRKFLTSQFQLNLQISPSHCRLCFNFNCFPCSFGSKITLFDGVRLKILKIDNIVSVSFLLSCAGDQFRTIWSLVDSPLCIVGDWKLQLLSGRLPLGSLRNPLQQFGRDGIQKEKILNPDLANKRF